MAANTGTNGVAAPEAQKQVVAEADPLEVPQDVVATLVAFGMRTNEGQALWAGVKMGRGWPATCGLRLNGASASAVPETQQG